LNSKYIVEFLQDLLAYQQTKQVTLKLKLIIQSVSNGQTQVPAYIFFLFEKQSLWYSQSLHHNRKEKTIPTQHNSLKDVLILLLYILCLLILIL